MSHLIWIYTVCELSYLYLWHFKIIIGHTFLDFQKYLEIEDAVEEDRKQTDEKVESLESIVRMLELKTKNSSDHSMYHISFVKLRRGHCMLEF